MSRNREKILKALENKEYKYRTITGISKETGLSENIVRNEIERELRSEVKVYPRKSKDGQILITTKKRFQNEASVFVKLTDTFRSKEGY